MSATLYTYLDGYRQHRKFINPNGARSTMRHLLKTWNTDPILFKYRRAEAFVFNPAAAQDWRLTHNDGEFAIDKTVVWRSLPAPIPDNFNTEYNFTPIFMPADQRKEELEAIGWSWLGNHNCVMTMESASKQWSVMIGARGVQTYLRGD